MNWGRRPLSVIEKASKAAYIASTLWRLGQQIPRLYQQYTNWPKVQSKGYRDPHTRRYVLYPSTYKAPTERSRALAEETWARRKDRQLLAAKYGMPRRSLKRRSMRLPKRLNGFYRKSGYYGRYNRNTRSQNFELKFFDHIIGGTTLTSTGVSISSSLNLIVQGIGENERIGRRCTIHSIEIHGKARIPTTTDATKASDLYRIVIYIDTQCNGTAATWLQLFDQASVDSHYRLENQGRFIILFDKRKTLTANAGAGNGTANDFVEQYQKWDIKKRLNTVIEYAPEAVAITTIKTNNLGIVGISADGLTVWSGTVRLRLTG